jgi:predicted transcriptional regulator
MNEATLTIGVRSLDQFVGQVAREVETQGHTSASLYFSTAEDLFKTIGGRRWEILQALAGQGEIGVRELARRVKRELKSVYRDTEALVAGGVIEKTVESKLYFPYSRIVLEPLVFDSSQRVA